VAKGAGANYAIYLRKTDGSPAVRLGDGAAMALSPDGKWVLSIPRGSPAQLALLPTGSGESRRVTNDSINHVTAAFLPDGNRILFAGNEARSGVRLFVQDLKGGKPCAISPEGHESFGFAISPDGSRVAAVGLAGETWLYPIEGGQPAHGPGIDSGEAPVRWSRDGRSLYIRSGQTAPLRLVRLDLATGRRELWKEISPADTSGLVGIFGLRAAPEAGAYAYTYGRSLSDLYLVGGIR